MSKGQSNSGQSLRTDVPEGFCNVTSGQKSSKNDIALKKRVTFNNIPCNRVEEEETSSNNDMRGPDSNILSSSSESWLDTDDSILEEEGMKLSKDGIIGVTTESKHSNDIRLFVSTYRYSIQHIVSKARNPEVQSSFRINFHNG